MIQARNYHTDWFPTLFNDFIDHNWMPKAHTAVPALNVIEHNQDYQLELAVPGMTRKDFAIHIDEDNRLLIKMEHTNDEQKEENQEGTRYLRHEFTMAKYEQAFILPDDVAKEHITARVADGVLYVSLPKVTPEEKAKAIKAIEVC